MFDANLRHLPKGTWFFAKVYNCKGRIATAFGLKRDDIVVAHMLDDDTDNPRIEIYKDGKKCVMDDRSDGYKTFLAYEGNFDLTGFINDKSLEKAKVVKLEHELHAAQNRVKELHRRINKAVEFLEEEQDDSAYNAICTLEGRTQ